jgi:hypothetical protein
MAVMSADRHSAEALAGVGLPQLVDLCVSGTEAEGLRLCRQPDPAIFLEALGRLDVAQVTCLCSCHWLACRPPRARSRGMPSTAVSHPASRPRRARSGRCRSSPGARQVANCAATTVSSRCLEMGRNPAAAAAYRRTACASCRRANGSDTSTGRGPGRWHTSDSDPLHLCHSRPSPGERATRHDRTDRHLVS